jgi:hypothetical protein
MNKFILLLIGIFIFVSVNLDGQDPVCYPDSTYADSLAGVYPGPYHPVIFPDGGITDIACINHPFEMVLTAVIRDSISYAGFDFKLNHLKIEENGILGMPEGLDYACNPPSCFFESNTLGCLVISGTPTGTNQTGAYDLKLISEIVAADGLIYIKDTLPDFLIPGSYYYLNLESEDSENCMELNTFQTTEVAYDFKILSNPVGERLKLELDLAPDVNWEIQLMGINTDLISRKRGRGPADLSFDMVDYDLAPGTYFVRMITKSGIRVKKMLIIKP